MITITENGKEVEKYGYLRVRKTSEVPARALAAFKKRDVATLEKYLRRAPNLHFALHSRQNSTFGRLVYCNLVLAEVEMPTGVHQGMNTFDALTHLK